MRGAWTVCIFKRGGGLGKKEGIEIKTKVRVSVE